MKCLIRKDSGRKLEQSRTTCINASKDSEQRAVQDPLAALDQIEDEYNPTLDEETVTLLTSLLENVEEFEDLRKNLINLIEEEAKTETKLIDLFHTLIRTRSSELDRI